MELPILEAGARALGLPLAPAQLSLFASFAQEMLDWNQRMNLTAITDWDEIQSRHFVDSLSCLLALREADLAGLRSGSCRPIPTVDIGAGAGFPGIPLRIYSRCLPVALVESIGKKVNFLRHVTTHLGLTDATVVHGRAEEIGQQPEHRARYQFAVCRAVASMSVLAEYALPLLAAGGTLCAQKKGDIAAEVKGAEKAFRVLGGRLREVKEVRLPLWDEPHLLVIVDKVRPTPKSYPRSPGTPAKQPL